MKKIKETKKSVTFRSNRGHILHITCHYAKKTPDGFWEDVYNVLERCGVFEGILPTNMKKLNEVVDKPDSNASGHSLFLIGMGVKSFFKTVFLINLQRKYSNLYHLYHQKYRLIFYQIAQL